MLRVHPVFIPILGTLLIFVRLAKSAESASFRKVLAMSETEAEQFYAQFQTYEALETYFFGGESLSEKYDAIWNYARHSPILRKKWPEFYDFERVQKVYSELEKIPLDSRDCGLLYRIVTEYIVEDDWPFTPEQKRYFLRRCIDRFLKDVESDNPEIIDEAFDALGRDFGEHLSEETISELVQKYLNLEEFKRMDWFYCRNIPGEVLGLMYEEPFTEEMYLDEFVIEDYVEELPLERRLVVHRALGACDMLRQTLAVKHEAVPLLREIVNLKMIIFPEAEYTLYYYTKGITEKQGMQNMIFTD